MGKHTDHTKPIDGFDDAPLRRMLAKHRREESATPLSATGHASLAAEYRGMGIDPALAAIVEERS